MGRVVVFHGHVFTEDEERYGFEYVVFRARNGDLGGYVSHFSVTDIARGEFHYDQRILGTNGVRGNGGVLDLELDGWTIRGGDGRFTLNAEMPGYGLRLQVAANKPPTLHDGDGYIDYGDGTGSYYASWTRMSANGALKRGVEWLPVNGEAWMDHQWGDFETYENGGWDWFSVQLDDGTDVMLYVIRRPDGGTLRVDGSLVAADGELAVLREGEFVIAPDGAWTSPATGTTYPSGWRIAIPGSALEMVVTPSMPDQELDTRRTTAVIYWEGEVLVAGVREGKPIAGYGYVELTGYAPIVPLALGTAVAAAGE